MAITNVPPLKGTYIFLARLKSAREIRINKRGQVHHFRSGWYAYVGSAFNSGGLKSRLNRHFHGSGRAHWHIDFFRKVAVPHNRAWISCQAKKIEREWSAALQLMPGVSIPAVNFGNSDDLGKTILPGVKKTHLVHLNQEPDMEIFQTIVDEYFPGNDPVVEIPLPVRRA
jgi:Uri superfamily endonuclease